MHIYARWTNDPGVHIIKWQWSMNYVFIVTLLLDASSNICVTHMHLLYKDENTYITRTTNSFMCRDTEKYDIPNTK